MRVAAGRPIALAAFPAPWVGCPVAPASTDGSRGAGGGFGFCWTRSARLAATPVWSCSSALCATVGICQAGRLPWSLSRWRRSRGSSPGGAWWRRPALGCGRQSTPNHLGSIFLCSIRVLTNRNYVAEILTRKFEGVRIPLLSPKSKKAGMGVPASKRSGP